MFSMFYPVFVFQGFFVWIGDVGTHHWGNTGTWTATLSKTVLGAGRGEAVLITLQGDWLVQVQHPWPIQWDWHIYLHLGGGFKYFLFSSLFGEMIQFDYISDGLKPPTSIYMFWLICTYGKCKGRYFLVNSTWFNPYAKGQQSWNPMCWICWEIARKVLDFFLILFDTMVIYQHVQINITTRRYVQKMMA